MEKNNKIWIIIVGMLLLITVALALFSFKATSDKLFFKNRAAEYAYLVKIVNESESNKSKLVNKWADILVTKDELIILPSEALFKNPSFSQQEYTIGKSDFYGYEFKIGPDDKIVKYHLYKP